MDIMNMDIVHEDEDNDLIIPKKISRKRSSIKKKLTILKYYDKVKSVKLTCQKCEVPTSTLRRWIDERSNIDKFPPRFAGDPSNLKGNSKTLSELEEALFLWYDLATRSGTQLTYLQIRERALEIFKLLNLKFAYNAADNWIRAWRKEYGIKTQKKVGRDFLKNERDGLESMIENENYQLCQIFKAEEIILEYKSISEDLEAISTNPKRYQNYVSVMICTNADGSLKLPIAIVGRSPEEKVLEACSDLVHYVHQKSAWMTSDILKNWFQNEFVTTVLSFLKKKGLPSKALLLIDDTPCHPTAESLVQNDIKTFNISPSLVKSPMEFYITDYLKIYYKKFLVQSILSAQKEGINLNAFLKKFKIVNSIDLLIKAWDSISDMTIFKCWKNTLPNHIVENKNDFENDKCILNREIYSVMNQIKEFQDLDEEIIYNWIEEGLDRDMYALPTSEELIDMICDKNLEEESEEKEINAFNEDSMDIIDQVTESSIEVEDQKPQLENFEEIVDIIKPHDVISAAEKIITFYEKNKLLTKKELAVIKKAKDLAQSLNEKET